MLGVLVGIGLGGYLEWYFNWGPAAGSPDRGEAHGYWVLIVGFPITSILGPLLVVLPTVVGRALIVLGIGATWGVVGAAVGAFLTGVREPSHRAPS